jgi:chemotaxis signal transduction protein
VSGAAHARWFLGVANIRGNLFSVVDFAASSARDACLRGWRG